MSCTPSVINTQKRFYSHLRFMKHIFLSFVLLLVVTAATAQSLPPYRNTALPIDVRVNDLLGRMTLDEKIDQLSHIHSDNGNYSAIVRAH